MLKVTILPSTQQYLIYAVFTSGIMWEYLQRRNAYILYMFSSLRLQAIYNYNFNLFNILRIQLNRKYILAQAHNAGTFKLYTTMTSSLTHCSSRLLSMSIWQKYDIIIEGSGLIHFTKQP